jgi:hypothetical protein
VFTATCGASRAARQARAASFLAGIPMWIIRWCSNILSARLETERVAWDYELAGMVTTLVSLGIRPSEPSHRRQHHDRQRLPRPASSAPTRVPAIYGILIPSGLHRPLHRYPDVGRRCSVLTSAQRRWVPRSIQVPPSRLRGSRLRGAAAHPANPTTSWAPSGPG